MMIAVSLCCPFVRNFLPFQMWKLRFWEFSKVRCSIATAMDRTFLSSSPLWLGNGWVSSISFAISGVTRVSVLVKGQTLSD
jgi:hypothetical protein